MASFAELTRVTTVDAHTYQINLPKNWCIGNVPHGGATTSCILAAARTHFNTTLKAQKQPHCIIIHLEFARRTSVGLATISIKDIKLGRQTSTIQVTLSQEGRDEVVGYLTHCDIAAEYGICLPTSWGLEPAPPVADLAKLVSGADPKWTEWIAEALDFRKATSMVNIYLPRNFNSGRGVVDLWCKFRNGERFTDLSLGFVCDMFPQIVETYVDDEEALAAGNVVQKQLSRNWYPTLALNLEFKKALPEEGVEWLFLRVRSKQIKNGRQDYEIIIMDDGGEIIALSHHVAMILSSMRNVAARGKGLQKDNDRSKL